MLFARVNAAFLYGSGSVFLFYKERRGRQMRRMSLWMMIGFLFVMTACSGVDPQTSSAEQKVKIVLDWTPNTNHTGLYVAKEKGYFKEQGLDVEIIQPGEAGADKMVASGQADFGIGYQEGLTLARVEGMPIVSIAAIIQHNTSGFASLKEKNIKRPKDFIGKKYGSFDSPSEKPIIETLMKMDQAPSQDVKMISVGNSDFFAASKRDIDFFWIYYGWTGIEAKLRGIDIDMIYLTDYSKELDFYTPIITTSESKIKKDPKQVEAFMKAVSKGYQFSIQNPEAAADILIKAEPDLDPKLVKESQKWLSKQYQADAKVWGYQKKSVWENYANWMKKHQLLKGDFDAEKAFTNQFLPDGGE